jgi:hypothetical protein
MLSFSPLYSASPTPLVREISMSLVKVEKYQPLSFILIGLMLKSYQSINSIPIGLMVGNGRYCELTPVTRYEYIHFKFFKFDDSLVLF